jgi:hypothetical protein
MTPPRPIASISSDELRHWLGLERLLLDCYPNDAHAKARAVQIELITAELLRRHPECASKPGPSAAKN